MFLASEPGFVRHTGKLKEQAQLMLLRKPTYHARRAVADARRERFLNKLGVRRVVRVEAELELTQPVEAVALVRAQCE